MKTLKKTLCLVLAMVMVFGLCAVSASAKLDNYSDKDSISYAEAVDVMTGIGILQGDAAGFRPKDTITRAEAAKIIAYVKIGDAAQADALKATSDPFNDVPASHWAAGYIAYCATAGIINGVGGGNFEPNNNVKGLEFAKMLLCALGYGQRGEYVGTDWSIYVSREALRLGVFDGNVGGASLKEATREECALYAFNAIAGTKEYTGIGKVSYSDLLGGYINNSGLGGGQNAYDANKGRTFGDDFGLKYAVADDDVFGRIAGHHWTQKVGNNTKIISADYDDDQRLLAVYTSDVSAGDIYKLIVDRFGKSFLDDVTNGATSGKNQGEFEFYLNNETAADDTFTNTSTQVAVKPENFTKGESKTLAYTGNGVQTYVYAWTEVLDESDNTTMDHIRICVIDTYLAKVTKVIGSRGGRDPETDIVLVDGGYNASVIVPANHKYTVNTEDFEVGDYVLVTITASQYATTNNNLDSGTSGANSKLGKVVDIDLAPTIETEVSKYIKKGNDVSIVAQGETYVAAKNHAGNDTAATPAGSVSTEDVTCAGALTNAIVNGDAHILYLDNYGYLVATSKVAEASNYAYVAQFGKKTNDATTLNDEDILRAHVYFADGTDEILTVNTKAGIFNNTDKAINMSASFAGAGDLRTDKIYFGTAADTLDPSDPGFSAAVSGLAEANIARIGVYKVSIDRSKNKVTLTEKYVSDHVTPSGASATYVTKGQANILEDTGNTWSRANDGTVFFYVKGTYGNDNFKVIVHTGINNVPTVKVADRANAALQNYITKPNSSREIMRAAYVKYGLDDGETSNIVYFFGGTQSTANFRKNDNSTSSAERWTVDYYVYGGDGSDYVTIAYDSSDDADDDIAAHVNKGFVKVEKGKLKYVAEDSCTGSHENSTTHKTTAVDNKIAYTVNADVKFVVGDDNDTLRVDYTPLTSDGTALDSMLTNVNMPLYKVRENGYVYDLRDEDDQDATTRGAIESVDELIQAFINGYVTELKVAISIEGDRNNGNTNVITGVYILDETTP